MVLAGPYQSIYMPSDLLHVDSRNLQYMNHSAAFHSLRRQLMLEVFELQRREYFGDGTVLCSWGVSAAVF